MSQEIRKLAAVALLVSISTAYADEPKGYLENIKRHVTLTTTITENGDLNPYAIVVAPVSSGVIHEGDVLVDNFNDISNLQGTGSTILDYNPTTKQTSLIAKLPKHLPQCPAASA